MNCNEWKSKCNTDWYSVDHKWDKKCREIQRSLKYNSDPKAIIRHHLRDTEEQRKYNDEHYELWGFEIDEDGNERFEYGKYMIFVTEEWHNHYHHYSEETRKRMRENSLKARDEAWIENQRQKHLGKKHSEETRKKMSESHKKRWADDDLKSRSYEFNKWTDERKQKFSAEHSGENASMYGKHHSQETKEKLSGENNGMYGKHHTEEARASMSKNKTGEKNGMYGKTHSDESKKKMSDTIKVGLEKCSTAYKEYRSSGGTMKWNDFRKWYRDNVNN